MNINTTQLGRWSSLRLRQPNAPSMRNGDRLLARVGHGLEFADARPYSSGDDVRFIDWPVYARTRDFIVRQRHDAGTRELRILLDMSGSMGFGTPKKSDYAAQLAATLATIAVCGRDRVELECWGAGGRVGHARAGSTSELDGLFDVLRRVDPHGGTPNILSRARTQLAVLLGDVLVEPGARACMLRQLAMCAEHSVLVHVLSDAELHPNGLSGRVRVQDSELGEVVALDAGHRLVREYRQHFEQWQQRVAQECHAYGVTRVVMHSDMSLADSVEGAFIECGLVEPARGVG